MLDLIWKRMRFYSFDRCPGRVVSFFHVFISLEKTTPAQMIKHRYDPASLKSDFADTDCRFDEASGYPVPRLKLNRVLPIVRTQLKQFVSCCVLHVRKDTFRQS